jgi:hypothetical protein
MPQRARRLRRTASGTLEIAPGFLEVDWSHITRAPGVTRVLHLERLTEVWAPYTDLYQIRSDTLHAAPRLYAVTPP